ncbi:MAG: CoA transferase, partial [Dehalococcoidia bacterium]
IHELDALFAQRDQWEWVEFLCERGLPVAPVQDYAQIVEDPQVIANDYVVSFEHPSGETTKIVGPAAQFSASPGQIRRPAPEFGEHTEEVLLEFGFSWDDISRLADSGAIGPK